MKIAICISTYRRPAGLKRLLESLNKLEFNRLPPADIHIVVVDNEPEGFGHAFCQQIGQQLRWPLTSAVEPRRGIAAVRNRSIACAPADAEFIAMIDDDEYAEPQWLEELILAQQTYDADVVTGRLIPEFDGEVPAWIMQGAFFERRRYETGERIKFGLTGNSLVRAEIFRKMTPMFDERFSLTGGEDTHFFTRVCRAGYKMIFSNEALLHETIPQNRATAKWLLLRAYGGGSIRSRCERLVMPSFAAASRRFVVGCGRMVQGLCLVIPGVFLGRVLLTKGLQKLFVGAGMVTGLFGAFYEEYQHKDGK